MRPELDPDAGWVQTLTGRTQSGSEAAIEEARDATALFAHLDREHRQERRSSYIEIDAPLELHALVRLLRPQHVLEVGVSSGVSSAYLLHALDQNGHGTLHSVDLPSRPRARRAAANPGGASWSLPPGRESGWAVPFALRARWDLRLGDKADVLPLLAKELARIDLFVYDVPHEEGDVRQEFRLFRDHLAAGGVVIADHGPGGGLCAGIRSWANAVGATPRRRTGLGLYGFQRPAPAAPERGRPRAG